MPGVAAVRPHPWHAPSPLADTGPAARVQASRSVTDAAVTVTASSRLGVSTTTCCLRPLAFFLPSKPLLVADTDAALSQTAR